MKSANQIYKESGSALPFKDWLIEEQKKGNMAIHDPKAFRNAIGDEKEVKVARIVKSNIKRNLVVGLGVVLCSVGAYHLVKNKS